MENKVPFMLNSVRVFLTKSQRSLFKNDSLDMDRELFKKVISGTLNPEDCSLELLKFIEMNFDPDNSYEIRKMIADYLFEKHSKDLVEFYDVIYNHHPGNTSFSYAGGVVHFKKMDENVEIKMIDNTLYYNTCPNNFGPLMNITTIIRGIIKNDPEGIRKYKVPEFLVRYVDKKYLHLVTWIY